MKRRRFIKLALAALAAPFVPKVAHTIVQSETVRTDFDFHYVGAQIQIAGDAGTDDLPWDVWKYDDQTRIRIRQGGWHERRLNARSG